MAKASAAKTDAQAADASDNTGDAQGTANAGASGSVSGTETPEEKAARQAAEVAAAMPQTKVYPDGSERRGCPPWPELSPLQEEQAQKRKQAEEMGEGTKLTAGDDPQPIA